MKRIVLLEGCEIDLSTEEGWFCVLVFRQTKSSNFLLLCVRTNVGVLGTFEVRVGFVSAGSGEFFFFASSTPGPQPFPCHVTHGPMSDCFIGSWLMVNVLWVYGIFWMYLLRWVGRVYSGETSKD